MHERAYRSLPAHVLALEPGSMLFSNLALSRKDANESLDNHRHFVSGIRGQFKSACPFNDGLNEFEIPVTVVIENRIPKPTAEAIKSIEDLVHRYR